MSLTRRLLRMTQAAMGYLTKASSLGGLPLYYWIEPTSACNLKCVMCPTGKGLKRPAGMMSWELFMRILDQLTGSHPIINLHHSGESTLHPMLPEMTRAIRERDGYVGYFTNATRLNDGLIERILDSPPNWLGFSFDGYDEPTYERIRVRARWDSVLTNIRRFHELRARRGQREPYTYMSIVELPGTSADSPSHVKKQFRELMTGLGLDQIALASPHNWAGLVSGITSGMGFHQRVHCPAPWTTLAILWDGRVVPCCMDMEARFVIGDAHEQTLAELWNSERMLALRDSMRERYAADIPLCANCHVLDDVSIAGIPRRAWLEAFDFLRSEQIERRFLKRLKGAR